jgi:hypothetical protein
MHYTMLLRYPERPADELSEDEVQVSLGTFDRWAKEMAHAGVLVSAEILQRSPDTVTLRIEGESLLELEGPAESSADSIGGIVVIDVAEHGDALAWARRAPSIAWGPVELRGAMVRFTDGEWRPEEAPEPAPS